MCVSSVELDLSEGFIILGTLRSPSRIPTTVE